MTGVVIGKVLDITMAGVVVEDHITQEKIIAIADTDEVLDLKIGETGIFVGTLYSGTIRVKRYEIRKFLDPLYEEELLLSSGKFTLISPIDDPFTETYKEFLEKRKQQELEQAEKEANELTEETTDSPSTPIPDESGQYEDSEDDL